MVLDLTFFGIFLGAAALLYLSGVVFRVSHLFLFGCVLFLGSSALLWSSGGLNMGDQANWDDATGQLTWVPQTIDMSNVGLAMFALILIGIPLVSFLTMDFNPRQQRSVSPFHY
jgi:hypothetical protein